MTGAEANQVALKAGMGIIKAERLEGARKLGEFVAQQGVIPIGRSFLILSIEHACSTLDQCDTLLADGEMKSEDKARLIESKTSLIPLLAKTAGELVKTVGAEAALAASEAGPVAAFGRREAVVPANVVKVEVNNGVGQPPMDVTVTETKP